MGLLDKLGQPMGTFGVSGPGPFSEEFVVDAPIGAGGSDRDVAFDGTLWFFTRKSAHKVEDIERAPQVSVAFADADQATFVAMAGKASRMSCNGASTDGRPLEPGFTAAAIMSLTSASRACESAGISIVYNRASVCRSM